MPEHFLDLQRLRLNRKTYYNGTSQYDSGENSETLGGLGRTRCARPALEAPFSAEAGNSGSRTYRTAEPKILSLRETNSRCGLTRAISRTKGSGTCRSFILPRASIASAATVSAFPFGRETGCGRLSPRRPHQIGPPRGKRASTERRSGSSEKYLARELFRAFERPRESEF
jgi:hypothetical protein